MNTIKQFEALFNYATIGIIVTDVYGTIINFNKKAEIFFIHLEQMNSVNS